MKLIANEIELKFNNAGVAELTFTTPDTPAAKECYYKLKPVVEKGKQIAVEIKQYRHRRSLDSNSYAWVLIGKIADAIKSSKEEVYIRMLERYGQREKKLISVITDAVDMVFRATRNHCTVVGESELNGTVFVHLAILIGSSRYDSRQMSIYIDGIVSECKDLNIETMTPSELERLKSTKPKITGGF